MPGVAERLRTPYGLAWNLEYNHRLGSATLLRANYLERNGRNEYVVDLADSPEGGRLTVGSRGRSLYRELALTMRYTSQPRGVNASFSYVRSMARADLNSYSAFFGSLRDPIIRPNEYGPTGTDVPHRVVGQARYQVGSWRFASLLEWRNGFPFSVVNAEQQFVGRRNTGHRFPVVAALDVSVERRVRIGRLKPYLGVQLMNALNGFTPREVQRNLGSPFFGSFYNSEPRRLRVTFRGF
jgi:hypothetical protein